MNKITDRIVRMAEGKDFMGFLTDGIGLADLQSLLLSVYEKRVSKLSPSDVLKQYQANRFVQPSPINPVTFIQFNQLALSLLPNGFQPIDLSPLAPLGSCSCLGPVSQNNIVTSIRNTEVVSDSTSILALECARLRRDCLSQSPKGDNHVKLATFQRQVRAQKFDIPHAFAHFMLFAMCSAGRDRGSFLFHIQALIEHIDFYIKLLLNLEFINMPVKGIRLAFFTLNPRFNDVLRMKVCTLIEKQFPDIGIDIDPKGERGDGYYQDVRFNIFACDKKGEEYFLADGGFTDWTQKLLQSRKERLFTSGIGVERIIDCFG